MLYYKQKPGITAGRLEKCRNVASTSEDWEGTQIRQPNPFTISPPPGVGKKGKEKGILNLISDRVPYVYDKIP